MKRRPREITVMDLGASHVACAVLTSERPGSLALQRLRVEELHNESGPLNDWVGEVGRAIHRIRGGGQWGSSVHLSLPTHVALTRFNKVPALSSAKLGRVLEFEAAQSVPYPLGEVSWGSVVFDKHADRADRDVMFAAARTDTMTALVSVFADVQFEANSAIPSCWALREGFRHCHALVSDPVLLVDVGARSTQLLFLHGSQFFTRSLPFGGNNTTQALVDELGIDFDAAEKLKTSELISPLGPLSHASIDRALARATEQFRLKLTTEISRALVHVERHAPHLTPRVVYLTGAGSLGAFLEHHVSDALKLSVKRCEPLLEVVTSSELEHLGDPILARLLPLVGMVSEASRVVQCAVDLRPKSIRRQIDRRRQRPTFVAAAALSAAAVLPPTFHVASLAVASHEQLADLEARVVPLRELKTRQAKLEGEISEARSALQTLESLERKRTGWMSFLADLQYRLARVEDVWLESLRILPEDAGETSHAGGSDHAQSPLKIEVSGRLLDRSNPVAKVSAESYDRVKQLIASFDQSPWIMAVEDETFDNGQPGILKFAAVLVIAPENVP